MALSPRLSSPRIWGSVCSLILWSDYCGAGSDRPVLKHSPLGRANPGPHPVPSSHAGCYTPGETQRAASPMQFHLVSIPGGRKASDRERGPIRRLPRRENTQTHRLISTHVHTRTPLRELWSQAQPSAVVFHGPRYISSLGYGLRRVGILINMAQGHGDLVVCVPWAVTLRMRITPTAAGLLSSTYYVPGTAQGSWETAMNKRGKKLCPCVLYGWRRQLINELNK